MPAFEFRRPVLREFHRQLGLAIERIGAMNDRQTWTVPAGQSNSAGVLARHLAGNANHYVGAGIVGRDYRRDREAEFHAPPCSRAALLAGLEEARRLLEEADRRIPEESWSNPWTTPSGTEFASLEEHLQRLATHAAYHLGQMGIPHRLPAD